MCPARPLGMQDETQMAIPNLACESDKKEANS